MRLLYCYPSYFTEELIDEIATNPKVRMVLAGRASENAGCLQRVRGFIQL